MRLITFIVLGFLSMSSIAQNNNEEALRAFFGDELYEDISANSSEKVEFYEFKNKHGYYLTQNPGKATFENLEDALDVEARDDSFPDLTEEMLDSGIDFLAYNFASPKEGYAYYKVGESDRILVVLSDEKLRILKKRTEE